MRWFKQATKDGMPRRKLGKTGEEVCLFSLGGQGALERQEDREKQVEIIRRAVELGVNYFDTSPIYGPSEDIYGEALGKDRKRILLASKTDDRTYDGSRRILEKSLKRLKTDYLDIWQIHHLDRMAEVDEVTSEDGALRALLEAKEEGTIRFLGFTGHEDPAVLSEMARRHDFDTVLCAVNAADVHGKNSFIRDFLPLANRQGLGIIGMKVFGQGYIFDPKGVTTAWEALRYVLSQPVSTVIAGVDDVSQLEEDVAISRLFEKLSRGQMKEIEEKTKAYPRRACFYKKNYGGYASKKKLPPPPLVDKRD